MATFRIQTFGCQMNAHDSRWLAAALACAGFTEATRAEVVILNTCSVREKPEQKVTSTVERIVHAEPWVQLIVVLGCVAQQLGEKLFAVSPKIRLVAGADNLDLIPNAISQLLLFPAEKLALLDFSAVYPERRPQHINYPSAQATISIMQGCDNFCAYCIVPFTRGRQKFRDRGSILQECRDALACGVKDITLLGQNVNVWSGGFASLLRDVAALPGLMRLHFVTPHPAFMDADVIKCFADLPNLAPRLHLPLQAGSNKILKAMGRKYDRATYLKLIAQLRDARPDLALSTDLIVGFPGETEVDFRETLEMVQASGFMAAFSFCYSDRPGTRASLMPDKIPKDIKGERLITLQSLLDEQSESWLSQQLGQERTLLLECPSPRGEFNSWQGRDEYGTCVHVVHPVGGVGNVVRVRIKEAKKHCLMAELI